MQFSTISLLDFSVLFILGACFGSFGSVLIERWKSGKWGILFGRSECPKCHHILSAWELMPLLSYVLQWGKCKKCHTPIGSFYPILELIMGCVFMISGFIAAAFWYTPNDSMWWLFLFWSFITAIYIVYDLRYMEIPDQVLIPGIYGTLLLLILWYFIPSFRIFYDIQTYPTFHTMVLDHLSWALVLYTFLYLQILIPGSYALLRSGKKKECMMLMLSYITFPFMLFIDFVTGKTDENTNEIDIPTWVGWGDLRVALFIGLTLGTIHGVASFIFAYILWSIIGTGMIAYKKFRGKWEKINSQIPFWPFLWIGWFLSLIYYTPILDYIIK